MPTAPELLAGLSSKEKSFHKGRFGINPKGRRKKAAPREALKRPQSLKEGMCTAWEKARFRREGSSQKNRGAVRTEERNHRVVRSKRKKGNNDTPQLGGGARQQERKSDGRKSV